MVTNCITRDRVASPSHVPRLGYQPMSTPIWLDEHGRRLPTRKCFKTDQEWAVRLDRDEHLRMNGWKLNKTLQIVVPA